jgi:circadian clock protein KaiC
MNDTEGSKHDASDQLSKSPTGILGFDEITDGGLPQGRPTLVCGPAGSGKTLFAMEFLVRGATEFDEPGVFISFEETEEELTKNVSSLGFDLKDLVARGKLFMDYVAIEPGNVEETGEFDLDGLFIRLGDAIETVGPSGWCSILWSLFAGLPTYYSSGGNSASVSLPQKQGGYSRCHGGAGRGQADPPWP